MTCMRVRGPVTAAVCAFVVLSATWAIATSARAGGDRDAPEAARLMRGTRDAAEQHDFTGTATVSWTTARGDQQAQVRVTDVDGSVTIDAADGGAVVDDGRRTYLKDHLGWQGLVVEPAAHDLPAPDQRWSLRTAGSRMVAGRPATVVVAARPGGKVAQRVAVDDATGLLLDREVVGPDGNVQRAVRFTTVDVDPRGKHGMSPPAGVKTRTAEPLASVPDGYRTPGAPAGFELVTRSRHPDGVLLFYSDGVFSASVFEQQGELDWSSLPPGGSDTSLADTRTRLYHEPSGDVAVWARHGLVYTCVTDAPSDVFARMVGALASDDRSTAETVVDFVLDPFGWG
jgi:MucB/RseB family protein